MFKLFCVTTTLLIFYTSIVAAGNVAGYHYEKPSLAVSLVEAPSNLEHGHSFESLPTVQPLPPVPALPPLPTASSKGQFLQSRTIYQTHPVASFKPLQSTYVASPSSNVGKIAQQYHSPQGGTALPLPLGGGLGSNLPSATPAAVQPLRVPFGKKAVINFPSAAAAGPEGAYYEANGRQLKQYAVIEIIDNDIEQNTQPLLGSSFFENYRATHPQLLGGIQLGSRASATLSGQQRIPARPVDSNAVALGSGGLGFIRLANGNVYLGSGSLGYISGQQHSQDIFEARTRSGAQQPDALHFGHGPLGIPNTLNKFSYRFN